jgi:hypothetical protein
MEGVTGKILIRKGLFRQPHAVCLRGTVVSGSYSICGPRLFVGTAYPGLRPGLRYAGPLALFLVSSVKPYSPFSAHCAMASFAQLVPHAKGATSRIASLRK